MIMAASKSKIAAIAGSLAALAIILSPVSPLAPLLPSPSGASDVFSEEPVNETAIAPPNISEEDFEECNSVGDGIDSIIVAPFDTDVQNRTIASSLLIGEYCNRPQLVDEISVTWDPSLTLVAYACDSALGKIGDKELKDSLSDHTMLYCRAAELKIMEDSEFLLFAAETFREELLALEEEEDITNTTATFDRNQTYAEIDRISAMAASAQVLLQSDQFYDSAKILDDGFMAFEILIKRTQGPEEE
jgi:hypothetical protein